MLEYLAILLSFITGGGISTLISLRYIRKVGKIDYTEKAIAFIEKQLNDWGCKYHMLRMNHKPNYDLFICDKSKRIEEI